MRLGRNNCKNCISSALGDNRQDVISTKRVITEKNGETMARPVARGIDEDFPLQRDSPTVGKRVMSIFLTIGES